MNIQKKTHRKKRWSTAETDKLVNLWESKLSIAEIAVELKRSEPVIRAKVSSLRNRSAKLDKQLYRRMSNYKLDTADIPKIRGDKRSLRLIAEDYDIAPTTVFKIKNKETWKHVR